MGVPQALAAAYQERDLAALAQLLHDNVFWGDPEDPANPGACHGRDAVLAQFRRLLDLGVEGSVVEVLEADHAVALGLSVRWPPGMPDRAARIRYQIFRFDGAQVIQISGTDDRAAAVTLLGGRTGEEV